MVKRIVVSMMVVGILVVVPKVALACTFIWDKVSTYTNGQVIPVSAPVRYKLYFTPQGGTGVQTVGDTDLLTLTLLCPAGSYYLTAYTSVDIESEKSNVVMLNQVSPVTNLRWSK